MNDTPDLLFETCCDGDTVVITPTGSLNELFYERLEEQAQCDQANWDKYDRDPRPRL